MNYRVRVEIDVEAKDPVTAALLGLGDIKALRAPVVDVTPWSPTLETDDESRITAWQTVDFDDLDLGE